MPLTHVCIWDNGKGYRPIDINQACDLYPYKVSAKSGIFSCSLCGGHVLLTGSGSNVRHFRHTSLDQNKICEERALVYESKKLKVRGYPLPFKIEIYDNKYSLKLGVFHPASLLDNCDLSGEIIIVGNDGTPLIHSLEKFNTAKISYFELGSHPCEYYELSYNMVSEDAVKLFPKYVTGFDSEGALFVCGSNEMIHEGGIVYPFRDYYLLQPHKLLDAPNSISYDLLYAPTLGDDQGWYLYKIRSRDFSNDAACFFLRRSVYLRQDPPVSYPIWPAYTQDDYFLYHEDSNIYFYVEGEDSMLSIYPSYLNPTFESLNNGRLYRFYTEYKEQVLSLSPYGDIGFSYLQQMKLDRLAEAPEIKITDESNRIIVESVIESFPEGSLIKLTAPYDGKVVIKNRQVVASVMPLTSNNEICIDVNCSNTELLIYQGLDLVRRINFHEAHREIDYQKLDIEMLTKLQSCSGVVIKIPHSVGAMASKLSKMPKTRQWMYRCIRRGEMPREALNILVSNLNNEMEK